MRKVIIVFSLFLLVAGSMVWAHGTGQHVLSTVTAIQDGVLHVKTRTGETITVETNAQTRYQKRGESVKSLPQVGDRVILEITTRDGALVATEVQFSGDKKAAIKK